MLTLSRREDQRIYIEKDGTVIELLVVRIGNDSVRIGIQAPLDWNIRRDNMKKHDRKEETTQDAR